MREWPILATVSALILTSSISRRHSGVSFSHVLHRIRLTERSSFGTYYFIFAEGIVASIFVWFFLPETKGRALEELDAVFALPWYKIGRVGRMYADDKGLGLVHVSDEVASAAGTEKVEIRRDDEFDKV